MENNSASAASHFIGDLSKEEIIVTAESLFVENVQPNSVAKTDLANEKNISVEVPELVTPISILKYLSSVKEFELYYYLFNQISITKIEDHKIEISCEGAEKSLNLKLAEILFTWTGQKWNVIIIDTSDKSSLKKQMKIKFMESEEWKMLQDFTSEIALTDIILE